jgi:hypothetical protein
VATQDEEVIRLRRELLCCAQEASAVLCAELRRGGGDEAFWRARACGGGAAPAAAHVLEQAPAALLALLTWRKHPEEGDGRHGGVARPAEDMQARLAALREPLRALHASLAAVHAAVQPLGAPLLEAPSGARMPAARTAAATAAADLSAALSSLASACALVPLAAPGGGVAAPNGGVASAAAGFSLHAARSACARAQRSLALATSSRDADAGAGYPLGVVPPFARRPGRWRRRWPRYALAALAAAAAARWLLARHRSGELARWAASSREAVTAAYREHVVAPLRAVADELFATFRARTGSVAPETLEASRASLERMLSDFATRHASPDADALAAMEVVMRTYESEVAHPLRGLVAGDLAWALLIQVQKLKTDTEASMRAMDQVLRANELTIALVAALPSLGIVAGALAGASRLLARPAPAPGAAGAALRRHFAAAERALEAERALLEAPETSASPSASEDGSRAAAVARGRVLSALDGAHDAAAALMAPAARPPTAALAAELGVAPGASAVAAQWDAFQRDALALATPPPALRGAAICDARDLRADDAARKAATAARMVRTFPALMPPLAR